MPKAQSTPTAGYPFLSSNSDSTKDNPKALLVSDLSGGLLRNPKDGEERTPFSLVLLFAILILQSILGDNGAVELPPRGEAPREAKGRAFGWSA